jgi:hypothetical protein
MAERTLTEPRRHAPIAALEILRWCTIALMLLGIIAAVAIADTYVAPHATMNASPEPDTLPSKP